MKKLDLIIISSICLFAAVLACVFMCIKADGKMLVVKQNNKVVAEYPLNTDREVKLSGNTFVIKFGKVYMKSADCKNQICVKSGEIENRGECIVCLPNRVILEIR